MIANVSYPPLSAYMRTKVRLHMVASRLWTSEHQKDIEPCDLCPTGNRIATRTLMSFSYRIGPRDLYRVCHKCIGKLQLRREREQPYAELRVYAPIRAQRLRTVMDASTSPVRTSAASQPTDANKQTLEG